MPNRLMQTAAEIADEQCEEEQRGLQVPQGSSVSSGSGNQMSGSNNPGKQCLPPQERLKKLGTKMWKRFEMKVKKARGTDTTYKYMSFGPLEDYVQPGDCDVPQLISLCINEIESRGCIPEGIYKNEAKFDRVLKIVKYFIKGGACGAIVSEDSITF